MGRVKDFFFSTISFYFYLIVQAVTKGHGDSPTQQKELNEDEYYYSMNRIYTRDKVKKMFFVQELPRLVDNGFLMEMKDIVESEADRASGRLGINGNCELIDIVTASPYTLSFGHWRTRSRVMVWKQRYEKALKEDAGKDGVDGLLQDPELKENVGRNEWMIESFLYVKDKMENKGSFCKSNIILELVANDYEILRECELALKDYVYRSDIPLKEVFIQTNEYHKVFSPAGNERENMLSKMNPPSVYTDELLASFDLPTHGKVGDDIGMYFGTDIHTGRPVFFDIRKGTDAINFLVCAKTGKGKSAFMKGSYSYFNLMKLNTVTLDYEGDEYTDIGSLHNASFIKIGGADSRYFNTIAIGDLTGDEDIDADLKEDAIEATERVFSLLLGDDEGMTPQETSLFSDAINRVYEKFGVTDDKYTWKKSKKITYFHLYGELVDMGKEELYMIEYAEHLKTMIIKLKTYFEEGGINRSLFRNPINVEEVMGSNHVIFSFGMKGTDESMINKKKLALKQLYVGYLTTLISNYNKSRGRLTVVLVEEMQRYLAQKQSASVVSNMVTGGRKRGMIMYLITNNPIQLVQGVEQSRNDEKSYMSSIIGNVNGLILGKLDNDVSEKVAEYFSIEEALPNLFHLNKEGPMKFAFLVKYKDEMTTVKFQFHPDLLDTLYATRKDQEDEVVDYG